MVTVLCVVHFVGSTKYTCFPILTKMEVSKTIALEVQGQKKFAKQVSKINKDIKSGKISIQENKYKEKKKEAEESRGLIYVAHLPHGFYENEINTYFQQFGRVTNVKVCRSRKTGNSKGYGYIEFAHPEVAKIAAETMNNYIMFKKRLIAEFVPYEKRPKHLFHGKQSTTESYSTLRKRKKNIASRNMTISNEMHLKKTRSRVGRLQKKLQKLKKIGIDYHLEPVDVPTDLKLNKTE